MTTTATTEYDIAAIASTVAIIARERRTLGYVAVMPDGSYIRRSEQDEEPLPVTADSQMQRAIVVHLRRVTWDPSSVATIRAVERAIEARRDRERRARDRAQAISGRAAHAHIAELRGVAADAADAFRGALQRGADPVGTANDVIEAAQLHRVDAQDVARRAVQLIYPGRASGAQMPDSGWDWREYLHVAREWYGDGV